MTPQKKYFIASSVAWTKSLAKRKTAIYWLIFLSFIESSFFPLPADLLFIPMVAAEKIKSYWYALLASVSSVAGTILGWAIGRFFFETLALPILNFYGKSDFFFQLQNSHSMNMIIFMLLLSGFSHIPPIKIVTILAGTLNVSLSAFLLTSIITRFARFYLLAWLIKNYSEKIVAFFIKRLTLILIVILVVIVIGYWLFFKN